VLDDEIDGWLVAILEKTDHVIFVSDSCHSASVTRGQAPKVRAAPPDARPHPYGRRTNPKGSAGRIVRIGAARDVQSAAEFRHDDGTYYGMFTWHWAQALDGARPGATWSELFQRATALVQQSRRVNQQPQMEGNPGLLVFAGEFAARTPSVPVVDVRRGGTRVSLGAGDLAGVTVGSVYELHNSQNDAGPAARLEIARVWPHESEGVIRDGELAVGDLVTESSHAYTFSPIRVFVTADDPADQQSVESLQRVVSDLPAFTLATLQAESDLVLRVLRPARNPDGDYAFPGNTSATLPRIDRDAQPEVWLLTSLEALVSDDLRIALSDEKQALRLIRENLTTHARIREFRSLANAGEDDSPIAVEAIIMTAVDECPDGADCRPLGDYGLRRIRRTDLDSIPAALPLGTMITFVITNGSATDYYVYVISAGPDGKITPHFPTASDRGDLALLGNNTTRDLFEIPRIINLTKAGEEIVKVIATRQPINVRLLQQEGYVRRGIDEYMNPLERLLASTIHGTRNAPNVANDSWSARTINIAVTSEESEDR
jgi:hypothetical protein